MERYFDIHLFDVAGTPITLATVVTFFIIILTTIVIAKVLEAATVRGLRIRKITHEGTVAAARRLVHYVVLLIGFGVGLQTIGINLSTLFAAGALFAVAAGFAMQNIAQNFVAGFILLIERSIKPGDILEVDGQLVRVASMGIRTTVSRTLNEEEIILPNSLLVQNTVKNFTLKDSLYRLRATVGVAYSSDMSLVRKTLEATAHNLPWRVESMLPRVLMREFGNSSVNFEVSVWINNPWTMQRYLSALHEAIWWALKDAGIVIAFPQVDVHFDSRITETLEAASRDR